jgi:integrase
MIGFSTPAPWPINNSGYLQDLIKHAVCKSKDFPEGIESFHTHSCRHAWATQCAENGLDPICIMALGGWKTWSSMQRYVRTSKERIETQYHEAAQRGAEERRLGPETVVSLADLVAQELEKGVSRSCGLC